ncbi:alanine racemase C-terminal domain-containing protein [Agreia bicolorata]|uniref:alanine racemase C-terminal domain-containing protein n=1 Tax=Agreia bicolorata TaxID=110935 RepID=UPI0005C9384D|nr:alanine racemase C-terminal domain-containing protein [Agreia bicolorata]
MSSALTTHPSPPRRAAIDLAIVRGNARILIVEASPHGIVVDLRGDAYGHGAVAIAAALDGEAIDAFLVSHDDDARAVRESGVSIPAILRSQFNSAEARLIGPEIFGLDTATVPDPRGRGLLPAMTLSACVLSIKRVSADEGVSYGYVYRTARPTTLAMVCLGYSDGIDRHACNGGRAWFAGSTHPIAGRVAMDVFMLDVGENPVSPGDEVVLFGDEAKGYPSPVSWAASLGKTAAEVTASLGDRIVRSYA